MKQKFIPCIIFLSNQFFGLLFIQAAFVNNISASKGNEQETYNVHNSFNVSESREASKTGDGIKADSSILNGNMVTSQEDTANLAKSTKLIKENGNEVNTKRQPNVIVIFTDDQGSQDMNIYGAEDLITPHMDALARRGVRFTQFYAASSVCSPSRAALLTGKYPQRVGVPGVVGYHEGNEGMPSEHTTMAETFKGFGYRTGLVGKWHLGYLPETLPNGQGFDYFFGHQGGCIDNYSHFFYWNGPNRHDLWRNEEEVSYEGKFYPDLMAEEVEKFMEENQQEPFFLFWAINVPHYPLQPTEKWRGKYRHLPHPRKEYAAFISTMDEMIGKVMVKLDDLGLRENTIVVFQSDHGHSVEERTFGGGGNAGPYRGAKGSLFEGGIRVPAMISWPGKIPAGEVRDQIATGTDWLPTLAEICGLNIKNEELDGKSLVRVIQSNEAKSPHQTFHWALQDQWAVRSGPWKLYANPKDPTKKANFTEADQLFLVNLEDDPSEMENMAQKYPQKVMELKKEHEEWVKRMK